MTEKNKICTYILIVFRDMRKYIQYIDEYISVYIHDNVYACMYVM